MKWQDVKDFSDGLRTRPTRTIFLFMLLLIAVFLVSLASGIGGKAAGELSFSSLCPWCEEKLDCEKLFETDAEGYIEKCE